MVFVTSSDESVARRAAAGTVIGNEGSSTFDLESAASTAVEPFLHAVFGQELPLRFEFFDGGGLGPRDGPGTVLIRSANALRRLLFAPGELGLARAYVAGDIEITGDLFASLRALHDAVPRGLHIAVRTALDLARAAYRLGGLSLPPSVPQEEARLSGRRHSKRRDERAIQHHYDVGNDFYRLFLGPTMVYSCGRFEYPLMDLEEAQASKNDLVCRKLGLNIRHDARLLDVGCGWGSLAMHAASNYGARVVGITLSSEQAELARQRVREAQLNDQIEIRLQDYRDLKDERFDAISSIGMFEHVGRSEMRTYFQVMQNLLVPTGRFLNHAISSPGGSKIGRRSFIGRYVFPDGELLDVGDVVHAMERASFEIRDVESLREHYSKTLHAWVENLVQNWNVAVGEVGVARARIWRLYMAASANGFDDGDLAVHQVLGVKPDVGGRSAMPPTRSEWR